MINLDLPFKLIPIGPDDDKAAILTTPDEAWLVFRQGVGPNYHYLVSSSQGRGKPRNVPSVNAAVCEIKERITGRQYHRHPPRIVV